MANRRRWAALRYARLIAEVKRDTEVASAVEIGASEDVSRIANGVVVSVSNTQFQGYVSNTNSRLTTLESDISVKYLQLFQSGNLEITTGDAKWVAPSNLAISSVQSFVDTAPTGSSINGSLNINGNSQIDFVINSGETNSIANTSTVNVSEYDSLTVQLTQVGSSNTGSDLTVLLSYELQ